jgi:hypothetical protein
MGTERGVPMIAISSEGSVEEGSSGFLLIPQVRIPLVLGDCKRRAYTASRHLKTVVVVNNTLHSRRAQQLLPSKGRERFLCNRKAMKYAAFCQCAMADNFQKFCLTHPEY